ncbi:MAG: Fic family protein, partial [Gammaproteobacteria bacterium]|nr:Fic family protein [Gammaproteobacteria bacterium]
MQTFEPDMKPDAHQARDRGESVARMEPMRISSGSRHRARLLDLVVELVGAATGLRRSLPDGIQAALADCVRAMNCYYSNLIEG